MESINDIELIKEFESIKKFEPIQEFGLNIMVLLKYYLLGSFMLLGSFLLLAHTIFTSKLNVLSFLVAILFFGVAILYSKHKIIKIYENHFELKTRFFSTVKYIQNSKFIDYRIEENYLVISYKDDDESIDEVVINESSMRKDDFDEFLIFLLTIKKEGSF